MRVRSNADPSDSAFVDFKFSVIYQVIQCSPNLTVNPVTIQSQYDYLIGSGPLSITLDGIHNGSCFFAVSLIDLKDDNSEVTSTPPFTLTQPTLVQNDLYLPNDYSITADSVLSIDESNDDDERIALFWIIAREDPLVPSLATDPFYEFKVIIYKQNDCTPGFRNVPENDLMYFYVLQEPALTIEFPGLDDTECYYTKKISGTTSATSSSPSAFQFNEATFV